jgi:hypothetical protein
VASSARSRAGPDLSCNAAQDDEIGHFVINVDAIPEEQLCTVEAPLEGVERGTLMLTLFKLSVPMKNGMPQLAMTRGERMLAHVHEAHLVMAEIAQLLKARRERQAGRNMLLLLRVRAAMTAIAKQQLVLSTVARIFDRSASKQRVIARAAEQFLLHHSAAQASTARLRAADGRETAAGDAVAEDKDGDGEQRRRLAAAGEQELEAPPRCSPRIESLPSSSCIVSSDSKRELLLPLVPPVHQPSTIGSSEIDSASSVAGAISARALQGIPHELQPPTQWAAGAPGSSTPLRPQRLPPLLQRHHEPNHGV